MFWGYLLCLLLFLLTVHRCTPHTNVNQGHTLYPATYNALNSCFSLISSVSLCECVCVCEYVCTATTGALLYTNMEKYQTVHVHVCIFVCEGASVNAAICKSESNFQAAPLS